MPTEEVIAPVTPAAEGSETEISIADYRKTRSEGKETEAPAPAEAGKTAPVTEAGKPQEQEEEEIEGTDKDGKATKVKVKGGFQRKIDKLTKEKSDLERTVGDLTSRLDALETKKPEVKVEARAEGDPEPKEENFKEYKEFAKALGRWVTRQEIKANQESTAKTQQEQAETERKAQSKQQFDRYLGEMRAVKDSKPDFDAVFADTQFPDYIHNRLVRMEKGAEAAYELAKNKEVLKKILDLNGEALRRGDNDFSEAYWEFGAFVRSLHGSSPQGSSPAPTTKTEKPVSQAPTPITPVGGAAGPTEIDPDKIDSVAEWRRVRGAGKIR